MITTADLVKTGEMFRKKYKLTTDKLSIGSLKIK